MPELRFYHLQKRSVEQALPLIVSKAYKTEKNIIIRIGETGNISDLDDELWGFDPASFLPHVVEGGKNPELNPIYLTKSNDNPNDAKILFLVSGASADDISGYDLVCMVFNGNDDLELKEARLKWKQYKDSDFKLAYWQQSDSGAWENKA